MTRDTAEERAAVVAHLLSYADEMLSDAESVKALGVSVDMRRYAEIVRKRALFIAEGRHVEEDK